MKSLVVNRIKKQPIDKSFQKPNLLLQQNSILTNTAIRSSTGRSYGVLKMEMHSFVNTALLKPLISIQTIPNISKRCLRLMWRCSFRSSITMSSQKSCLPTSLAKRRSYMHNRSNQIMEEGNCSRLTRKVNA